MADSWTSPARAAEFLARADRLPFRNDGERVLVADVGTAMPGPVLDLGCGDGRLTALVLDAHPLSTAVVTDSSPPMLDAAHARFAGDDRVTVLAHDFNDRLPFDDAAFAAVITSLAVHHASDERKRLLYAEAASLLQPGGVFANLEIVASPTQALHDRWRDEMGARDDPNDRLCAMEPQLEMLRDAGLIDVDCIWKWRSLALLRGMRPPT
ncbi:MAG: class I SAM-dependent methyltransferase [Acidimicrobiia bacterium]